MNQKKYTTGYSLVEVLIAVSILMLAIVAPMTIAVKSIQSAQYVHQQNTAIFLAQEGESIANAIRDNNGLAFLNGNTADPWEFPDYAALAPCFNLSGFGCAIDVSDPSTFTDAINVVECTEDGENCRLYFDESAGRAAYHLNGVEGTESPFIRRIFMADNFDEVRVMSTIEWNSHLLDGIQNVSVSTSYYNLYKQFE